MIETIPYTVLNTTVSYYGGFNRYPGIGQAVRKKRVTWQEGNCDVWHAVSTLDTWTYWSLSVLLPLNYRVESTYSRPNEKWTYSNFVMYRFSDTLTKRNQLFESELFFTFWWACCGHDNYRTFAASTQKTNIFYKLTRERKKKPILQGSRHTSKHIT